MQRNYKDTKMLSEKYDSKMAKSGLLVTKKQAALRQAALTKRRKEQGLTRLQVWVTAEQKQKVLAMLKGA